MSTVYNSSPPTGLVLNIDASNRKSHLEAAGSQRSLYDISDWTIGYNGTATYSSNQDATNESQRLLATDPWGLSSVVWQSNPSGNSNPDGGWDGPDKSVDKTLLYRESVWINRISSTSGGNYYFGLHTNGTGDTYNLSDGSSQTNPYWCYGGTASLTQNVWYLMIGHIFPTGWSGTTAHPNSGIWLAGPTKFSTLTGNITSDVKFPSDATTLRNRTYHFYCGDTTTHLQFACPRIDLVDGNEPTIQELFTIGGSQWRDTSSNKVVGALKNNPTYSRTNGGQVIFAGSSSQYVEYGNPTALRLATEISITSWVYPTNVSTNGNIVCYTDNSGYRFRINSDNSATWYVSGNSATSSAGAVPNNTWSHVAVVGDGVGLRIYINGVANGTSATPYTPTAFNGTFQVGAAVDYSEYFTGSIGYVRVYNRSLSAQDIVQDFNSSKKRFGL